MAIFDIFGSKSTDKATKIVGDVVGGAIKGLDALVFTKQERAEVDRRIASEVSTFVGLTLNESTVRSKTRRWLAWAFSGVFLALLAGAAIFGKTDAIYAAFLLELARELGSAVLAIVIFYFGYYGVNAILAGAKKKEAKK